MTTNTAASSSRPIYLLATLVLAAGIIWWPGCRKYPTVTSRESLTLAKLLYTASNTKDPIRLARAESDLNKLVQSGKVQEAEVRSFRSIIELAKSGDWSRAERESFRFVEDQVGRGSDSTLPHEDDHHDHNHAPKSKRK